MKGNTLVDYSKLPLDALKVKAQELNIKGRSKMNKAQLVEAITEKVQAATVDYLELMTKPERKVDKADPTKVSYIDGIKAAFATDREARRNRGRAAAQFADVPPKQTLARKTDAYVAQRNGGQLSAKQERRRRKAFRQGALPF